MEISEVSIIFSHWLDLPVVSLSTTGMNVLDWKPTDDITLGGQAGNKSTIDTFLKVVPAYMSILHKADNIDIQRTAQNIEINNECRQDQTWYYIEHGGVWRE